MGAARSVAEGLIVRSSRRAGALDQTNKALAGKGFVQSLGNAGRIAWMGGRLLLRVMYRRRGLPTVGLE
jgi:hypothetical protein